MTYAEALTYIHSISWKGSVLGLGRTKELLHALGDPQRKLKFIHIAGTNGKGSTAAMLSSILRQAGYRTGLYTSPFINRFNERMQIDGEQIPDETLAEVTARVRPFAEAMEDHPTEFELITAIALLYFSESECDIVVLEVGMGGELDSTNIIDAPEVAIITAMGYDHVKELGPTMADIARAKAGIIKRGCDVVSYGGVPEADTVIETVCREQDAALHEPDFSAIHAGSFSLEGQTFSYGDWNELFIPLAGRYQLNNAALVLTAVDVLRQRGWDIADTAVRDGLKNTFWPARFELLQRDPVFLVDGGHNPHGIRATAESLARLFPEKKIRFLVGVMADKDVESILSIVAPMAEKFYAVTPNNPRAMAAETLRDRIRALGAEAEACGTVEAGVARALEEASAENVICALGSLYMSGDVRACFPVNEFDKDRIIPKTAAVDPQKEN